MGNNEKKLSEYIDCLNEGMKPSEHEKTMVSQEMEQLTETVRLVRSLNEPELPGPDYSEKLAKAVTAQLSQKTRVKSRKRAWLTGGAAIAAMLVLALILNFIGPLGRTNIVYAMEQAFQEVKAYHGILEIADINAEGKETMQARREVWADKEGRYYVRELEGSQAQLVTVNNGQKKWQVWPEAGMVAIFPAFPDPYQFTFELGSEIEEVGNALKTEVVGEEEIAGRTTTIVEVSPQGGLPYRIWIDKETKLPLQKQSAMQNALQYKVTYTEIGFYDIIPEEMIAYSLSEGYTEVDKYPEQLVNSIEELEGMVGFAPRLPLGIPDGYRRDSISVGDGMKTVKLNYTSMDERTRVTLLQARATGEFKPNSMAVLGKIDDKVVEVQSPVSAAAGILSGSGPYSGVTDISAIRWQDSGYEFAVVGNAPLDELIVFVDSMSDGLIQIPHHPEQSSNKPGMEVEVNMEVEENEQKSVDNGHTPWRLDPVFVAHVFVNLQISPEGIQGEYPVDYTELKVAENNGIEAIVEVGGDITHISRVYLRRLVRQDNTGIWTVVGYDPKDSKTGESGMAQPGLQVVAVYFIRTDGNPGELYPVYRQVSESVDPLQAAMDEMLKGPTPEEYASGFGSQFSEKTSGMLNGISLNTDGTVTIDFKNFSHLFDKNGIPSPTSFGAGGIMADITWTVFRQFPDVQAIRFAFDGDENAFWSWFGTDEPEVFTRTDWEGI